MYFFTKGGVHGAFLHVKKGHTVTQYGKLDNEVFPPLMTFCVKDCDEALTKAKAHGGKVQLCVSSRPVRPLSEIERMTDDRVAPRRKSEETWAFMHASLTPRAM